MRDLSRETLGDAVVEVRLDPAAPISPYRGVRAGSCDGMHARLGQYCCQEEERRLLRLVLRDFGVLLRMLKSIGGGSARVSLSGAFVNC